MKKEMKTEQWFILAISCLVLSIVSLFTTIITYTDMFGYKYSFNIIDLLEGEMFEEVVLTQLISDPIIIMSSTTITFLAILAIGALVCAFVGLITLRAQYPSDKQFLLTLVGVIGTAIPSILIIIGVLISGEYYYGTIGCGIAPIFTPIAMLVCVRTVLRRKDKVKAALQAKVAAEGLLKQAGDL